jgi:tetratricopeptide (TPR) repeat protein
MKKGILFILVVVMNFGFARAEATQEDSLLCLERLSMFYEFSKTKNYIDAYKPWSWTFRNCPDAHKNIYIQGPRIVEGVIKEETDEVRKEALIDTLIMVYDYRNQYYPGQEGYVLGKRGSALVKYRSEAYNEAYDNLKESMKLEGNESSATTVFNYIKCAAKKFNDKSLDRIQLLEDFETVQSIIDYNLNDDDESNDSYYEKAMSGINSMLDPVLQCEDLIPIFEERLPEVEGNTTYLTRWARMLESKGCTDSDIYFSISEKLFDLNPGVEEAIRLGNMSVVKKNYSTAIRYYTIATSRDTLSDRKGETFYKIAGCHQSLGNSEASRNFALKAASSKSGWGDPYILIGDLYANTKGCGTNEFEVKTVYWAAIDKYMQAITIDPSVSEKANKRINTYKDFAPDKTLTFTYGFLEKPNVEVGCWIKESATIRLD